MDVPLAHKLPSDRHSTLLNLSRYARTFILSAEAPFLDRYRSYTQVFSEQLIDELNQTPLDSDFDALENAFSQLNTSDPVNKLFLIDSLTQLPDDLLMLTDKMTMATSLECRVPFRDNHMVELAASKPVSESLVVGLS